MDTLKYIILINLFGIITWPISRILFANFPDRGWVFSKLIGYFLTAWLTWSLASYHLLAFSNLSIILCTIITGTSIWLISVRKQNLKASKFKEEIFDMFTGKEKNYYVIFSECLFIGIFIFWNHMRTSHPDISGLEKFMDYGFMLSILKTSYFPPLDHFFSGETINYYYYGQYLHAFLAKITYTTPTIAYNLSMSFVLAMSCSASFSLGAAIAKGLNIKGLWLYIAGLTSAFLVNFAGNLHYVTYKLVKFLNSYFGTEFNLLLKLDKEYYYPSSTRYIPKTIHEYPLYSFVVNDLHAHVCNILTVVLILAYFYVGFTKHLKSASNAFKLLYLLGCSFLIGQSYAANAWDFAIYSMLFGFLTLSFFSNENNLPAIRGLFNLKIFVKCLIVGLSLISLSIVLFLPFWLNLNSPVKGIGQVPSGKGSAFYQLAIIWGLHLFFSILYLLRKPAELKFKDSTQPLNAFIFTLFLTSWILILLPELVYLKDIYTGHFRSNTMFKLGYQAWIILSIALGPCIAVLWKFSSGVKGITLKLLTLLLLSLSFSYTIKAINQGVVAYARKDGLDGFKFVEDYHPEDAKTIKWLIENIKGQPTIVEAVGESHSYFARVSSFTAFQSVLGWPVHEWLWRGSVDKSVIPKSTYEKKHKKIDSVGNRRKAIKEFYETQDKNKAKSFLDEYEVDLIYVGKKEREKYPKLDLGKLEEIASPIFEYGSTKVYQVIK